jgi:two-component system NtrC family sensor kinase
MSVRGALIGVMLFLVVLTAGILGALGAFSIYRNVLREAQSRVDHDLNVAVSLYERDLLLLQNQAELKSRELDLVSDKQELTEALLDMREAMNLTVLNLCDSDGIPIAGSYQAIDIRVPVNSDPVLRLSLAGRISSGTMLLSPERLKNEGGKALLNALRVESQIEGEEFSSSGSLFQWFSIPHFRSGQVVGLLYGGRALNHNSNYVDALRETIFSQDLFDGKPVGTVTIFLNDIRVATNVLSPSGKRAVGTRVSDEVSREVLQLGKAWRNRAWVVDSWYLSGYQPLRDPDENIVGMLYVGLLEAPYRRLYFDLLVQFLVPVGLVGLGVFILGLILTRRIIRPLDRLRESAKRIAEGKLDTRIEAPKTYSEISELTEDFRLMQDAIRDRDEQVRLQNQQLAIRNEQLKRTNENYMTTLRFVTHELKAPLAAIQTLIDVVIGDYLGSVPEKVKKSLIRIKQNSEELQGMVKDYLDLARAERGELKANIRTCGFCSDVIQPSLEQNQPLFTSRKLSIEKECPEDMVMEIDPELIRIALDNLLSNAAKYGRKDGLVRIRVYLEGSDLAVRVWNQGDGFSPEEKALLFRKFSRLQNKTTIGKRGSGLGLYLCKEIVELHKGTIWANSKEGEWAEFGIQLPIIRSN